MAFNICFFSKALRKLGNIVAEKWFPANVLPCFPRWTMFRHVCHSRFYSFRLFTFGVLQIPAFLNQGFTGSGSSIRAFFNIQAGGGRGGGNAPSPPLCPPHEITFCPPQEKSLFPKIMQTNQRRVTNR
jgi:hypothetical protein